MSAPKTPPLQTTTTTSTTSTTATEAIDAKNNIDHCEDTGTGTDVSNANTRKSAIGTSQKVLDNEFLRNVTWDDVVVIDGELQSIGGFRIEDFK
jgi:hypothetical protein